MEYWDQTTNTSWTAASDYVSSYLGTYSTMQPRYVYMVQSVGADGAGSGSSYQYFELTYPDSPDC